MTNDEMRERLAEFQSRVSDFDERRDDLTDDEVREWDETLEEFTALKATYEAAEERQREVDEVRALALNPKNHEAGDGTRVNVIVDRSDPYDLDGIRRTADSYQSAERELVERARRAIGEDDVFTAEQAEEAERKVRTVRPEAGYSVARHVLRTNSPAYQSAWIKAMSGRQHALTGEEAEALERANAEYRAASVGTTTAGGFLVPTILDPTVILTSSGTRNPFRMISNVKSVINQNGWTGVSSAGITASWDTEAAEVSDDTPTFAQPSVAVHKAAAFVPGSIEVFEDVPTLAAEIGREIVDAKDRLEEAAFATGTGTNQPTGIAVALVGSANATAMATNSAFAIGDVFNANEALPARWEANASWVMNRVHVNDIREMGGTSYYTRTVTLDAAGVDRVLGKPVYESTTLSSTLDGDTNNNIVYGDFNQYVIADRIGLSTEFIPHLFATGNNRPSGSRGIYAYWRVGADSVADGAFVLLYNPST